MATIKRESFADLYFEQLVLRDGPRAGLIADRDPVIGLLVRMISDRFADEAPKGSRCSFCNSIVDASTHSAVLQHVQSCPRHPMRAVEAELAIVVEQRARLTADVSAMIGRVQALERQLVEIHLQQPPPPIVVTGEGLDLKFHQTEPRYVPPELAAAFAEAHEKIKRISRAELEEIHARIIAEAPPLLPPEWRGTCPHHGCDKEQVLRGHCEEHADPAPVVEF